MPVQRPVEPRRACPVDRALYPGLTIMEKPAAQMSLRKLKDTLENLQVEWPAFLERLQANPNVQQNLGAVLLLIDQCAARFGALASRAGTLEVRPALRGPCPAALLLLPHPRVHPAHGLHLSDALLPHAPSVSGPPRPRGVPRRGPDQVPHRGVAGRLQPAQHAPGPAKLNYKHDYPEHNFEY